MEVMGPMRLTTQVAGTLIPTLLQRSQSHIIQSAIFISTSCSNIEIFPHA